MNLENYHHLLKNLVTIFVDDKKILSSFPCAPADLEKRQNRRIFLDNFEKALLREFVYIDFCINFNKHFVGETFDSPEKKRGADNNVQIFNQLFTRIKNKEFFLHEKIYTTFCLLFSPSKKEIKEYRNFGYDIYFTECADKMIRLFYLLRICL